MAVVFPPLPWGKLPFDGPAWQDWFKNLQITIPKLRGTATMSGGSVTVSNPVITANSLVFYSVQAAGGTQGFLRLSSLVAGSFTITSTSASETSTVAYLVISQ